jgi:hypothetical protein
MSKLTKGILILVGAGLIVLVVDYLTTLWQSKNNQDATGLQTWQSVGVMGSAVTILNILFKL